MSVFEEYRVWNETGLSYRKMSEDECLQYVNDLHHRNSFYNNFYNLEFEDKSLHIFALDYNELIYLCELVNNTLLQPHTLNEIKLNNILNVVDKHNNINSSIIQEAIKHIYKD